MSEEKTNQSIIYWHPHPNHDAIKHATKIHQEKNLSQTNQKIAVAFTKYFGSMTAFWILVLWMLLWMFCATIGIWIFRFDRYPFPFLLFCSNLIQLWALPVLAVGQNVLSKQQEAQAEATYENTKISLDREKYLIDHLTAQDTISVEQLQHIQELREKLQDMMQYFSHQLNDIKMQQQRMLEEYIKRGNTVAEQEVKRPIRKAKIHTDES